MTTNTTIQMLDKTIAELTAALQEAQAVRAAALKSRPLTVAELHAKLTTLIEVGAGDYQLAFLSNDYYGHDLGELSLGDNSVTISEFQPTHI